MSGTSTRDDAAEPLIRNGGDRTIDSQDFEERDEQDNILDESAGDQAREGVNSFIWLLTAASGISGLLFGYDTGVISSTLVSIHQDLSGHSLTTLDKSLITSATSFFALLASPCTGYLADAIGRKRVILLASCLFTIGALVQAFSNTVAEMIVGRAIVGAAVGAASFVVPLYIGELSPAQWRGRLVIIASLFITGGQVVAYLTGLLFSRIDGGWRWMVGLGSAPALIQLFMLFGMPETPRWLVKARRSTEAEQVLCKVYGSDASEGGKVLNVLHAIEREIQEEEDATGKAGGSTPIQDLFKVGRHRRALTIACLLQGAQQLCGFNSLMYFSATIFAMVGSRSPILASVYIAVTNFAFTVVAFFIIDKVGRRRILLSSIPWMVVGLLLCSVAFSFLDISTSSTQMSPTQQQPPKGPVILLVLALLLFVATYALGLGNVPWQQGELFALRVRSLGSSLSTATNWGSNTIVGLTFLPMMDFLTPRITFGIYAMVCVASWVAVWFFYPETAGLDLEEVGSLLDTGWGVEASLARWKGKTSER